MGNRKICFFNGPITLGVLAAALLLCPVLAKADLTITAPSFSAAAGTSGSFDVTLSNTGSSDVDVAGFSFDLGVSSGSGITFTGGSDTGASYIFASPSATFAIYGFNLNPLPYIEVVASDADFNPPYAVTLTPGETVGLATIDYTISPTASGNVPLQFDLTGVGGTAISDTNGNAIAPLTETNGNIDVTGGTAPAAPLPSSAATSFSLLGCLALVSGVGFLRRRTVAAAE